MSKAAKISGNEKITVYAFLSKKYPQITKPRARPTCLQILNANRWGDSTILLMIGELNCCKNIKPIINEQLMSRLSANAMITSRS